MNAQPHTHGIDTDTRWGDGTGQLRVIYGDTTCYSLLVYSFPFLKFRLRRLIARTIRKHDKGTNREARRLDSTKSVIEQMQVQMTQATRTGKWGSDLLKTKENA